MSLVNAAKYLESKGRNGDSMLVHMSPGEVKSLQGLALAAGGSLSINPDTGLVEASFLKRILPMIAGAGLAMIPGVGPLAAAGMVGGFETMRTGDLGRGLMAGLGAYGGAGLAQGLTSAGASSIAEKGGASAVNELGSQATNLSADQLRNLSAEQLQGLKSVADSGAYSAADVLKTANAANTQIGAQNLINAQTFPNLSASQLQGLSDTVASGAYNPADIVRTAGAQNATTGASGLQTLGAGFKAGPTAIYNALPTGTVPALGLTAANAMTPGPAPMPGIPGPDEYDKQARVRLGSGFTGFVPQRPNPYYTPTGLGYAAGGEIQDYKFGGVLGKLLGEKRGGVHLPEDFESGYAEGGDIMLARGGDFDDEPGEAAFMAAGGHLPRSSGADVGIFRDTDEDTAALDALRATGKRLEKIGSGANVKMPAMPKTGIARLGEIKMAEGGLGGYSDGGRMLKGPGDGMSDSIPGVIGGRQPARLADGEFVVPADVVSHLGNGSTDAGARKLYGMMDKIRKARTGKKKQAPAVKAEKYMPKA